MIWFGERDEFRSGSEDGDVSIFIAEIDFAVRNEWGSPGGGKRVIDPPFLAAVYIKAVQKTAEIGNVEQVVVNSNG